MEGLLCRHSRAARPRVLVAGVSQRAPFSAVRANSFSSGINSITRSDLLKANSSRYVDLMVQSHEIQTDIKSDTHTTQPAYFSAYRSVKMTRDAGGVLVVEFHTNGGPLTFTAQDHTQFVDAFYRIAQDRANKIVILTGIAGEFIPSIDFSSFGNVADPEIWSQVHDEGIQILENLANIRVPVIAAIEGHADVHSEYALLADVVVAGEGATFNDLPHFAGGIVPGDGIFTTWSYRAGAGRAEAFLLNPQPLTARTAHEWGVVAEVVPNGKALARARELASLYLKAPEVTRRNTRAHFVQPLKERIVREVGYGLSLEGASAAHLVKSMQTKI
jgi:enoyl-CoA hydratase/carnithine racemase